MHNESTIDVNRLCSPSSVDIDGQLDRGTDSTKLLVLTLGAGAHTYATGDIVSEETVQWSLTSLLYFSRNDGTTVAANFFDY